MFILNYDESFSKYTAQIGRELIYGITYELTSAAVESLQEPLLNWRTQMIEKEESCKKDIINTTPFSVVLNCKYYESCCRPGIRNPNKFTNYNCDCDDKYQHIATYHAEDCKVEEAKDPSCQQIGFYPWFVPVAPQCNKKKPPIRRDD